MNYYNYVLRSNQGMLALIWLLAVSMLIMGGLALPVSRWRVMGVRVSTGALQAFALAMIPSCCMYAVADFAGKAYAPSQFGFQLLLLLSGGSVFFGLAVLISLLIEGEYMAPAITLGIGVAVLMGWGTKVTNHSTHRFDTGFQISRPTIKSARRVISVADSVRLVALLSDVTIRGHDSHRSSRLSIISRREGDCGANNTQEGIFLARRLFEATELWSRNRSSSVMWWRGSTHVFGQFSVFLHLHTKLT